MTENILHILKGIRSLTQKELEKRLLNEKIDTLIQNSTKEKADLFIDLSQVQWVNIGAAFQLCLLIESLIKNDFKIFISLPFTENTRTEIESTKITKELKDWLKKSRKKANEFLKVINFDKAVLCEHINDKPKVYISEDFQFSKGELDLGYFNSVFNISKERYTPLSDYHDFNYNYIFPLTWINENVENYNELATQIEKILKDEERGLHHIDILSLKNVILSELIKNLREHAYDTGDKTKYALFSLALIKSTSLSLKDDDNKTIIHSSQIENNFLEGIIKSKVNSLIEIYFGDTGVGVSNKKLLTKYNDINKSNLNINNKGTQKELIKWSFDKWSTSKDEELRGTKGLYRIHRIVNKYNGIIHIRSKNVDGGFQKGGKLESEFISNQDNLYYHPGTFIQIKLCPQKEVLKYNLVTNTKTKTTKIWKSITYEIKHETINVDYFTNWFRNLLNDKFDNLIIIFQPEKEDLDIRSFFEDVFLKISELRHPKGIILYTAISIGKNTLEEIVNSTNERIKKLNNNSTTPESINPDFENIYDPVLLIGENNSISWYGGNQSINDILNELYQYNDNANKYPDKITELNCFKRLSIIEQNEILQYLQNDSTFFKISNNENILFNFTNICSLYKNILEESIEHNQFSEKNKKICSPKLDISDEWIYISKILNKNNSSGFALALYTILLNKKIIYSNSTNTFLFIDHIQQYSLALELARLLGIKDNKIINLSEDIDLELPRRTKLFNENGNILILTTVIASSETIRRLAKHIYRDKARPLAVLCLLNKREGKKSNILTTWDQQTEIYSIISEKNLSKKEEREYPNKNEKEIRSLSQSLKNESNLIIYSPKYEIIDQTNYNYELTDELKALFERTKSLHYNHFGKYNDRHYTFFLYKDKILEDSFISKNVNIKINGWVNKNNIDEYTLVIPENNKDYLLKCIDLANNYKKPKYIIELNELIKSLEKPDNLVFFDFGSLTGKTINKVISSNPCKKNLLIITVFAQFKDNEKILYSKIKELECEYVENKEDKASLQPTLFSEEKSVGIQKIIKHNINVTYITLFDLPIYFYQSIHCPICQHIEALDLYKLSKSKYLKDFSEDRKLRLKIKDYYHIPPIPVDPYMDNNNFVEYEMSTKLITTIYMFKRLLEYSINSTMSRIDLFKRIFSIYEKKEELIKDSESELYSLIYLLSYEIIWLQKEPLVFRNFRYLIYSLSKYISIYNIEKLTEFFSQDSTPKIGFNLATRYKYAAISVFRSANKFYYCKNISNIIFSSVIGNKIGNNILQNTLYHINSVHINRYNNSDIYFKDIDEQLEEISNKKEILLSQKQRDAIDLIKFNNKINRKEIELKNLSQVELFKKLKAEIYDIYETKSHPLPMENFNKIRIDDSKIMLKNISEERENAISYNVFKTTEKSLMENYDQVKLYIFENIIPHIDAICNFERNILLSYDYDSFTKKYYRFKNIIDEFDDFILKGSKDILYLIDNQSKYIEYCTLINETFIHKDDADYNIKNAQLFNFLCSIPSNLKESVSSVFLEPNFKNKEHIDIDIDNNIRVFFTKSLLVTYLKLILGNIQKRQNENYGIDKEHRTKSLDNCNIEIKAEIIDENVKLIFVYSNTEKFNKVENLNGNLNQFDKALKNYGGSLFHKLQDDGNYFIEIIFLNYV